MAQMDERLPLSGNSVLNLEIPLVKISVCKQQRFAGGGKLDIRPALFG